MSNNNLQQELQISRYIIIYKFILGILELILGLGIIFFGKQIVIVYESFKAKEFLEDPHDLLVNIVEKVTPFLFKHQGYIVLILLLLGVVKVIGSIGLMYRKYWGLDLLIVLTISLLPFQLYNLSISFSWGKLAYFMINILIALYLVKFQPKKYFSNLKHRIHTKDS